MSARLTQACVVGKVSQEVQTFLLLVPAALTGAPRGDGPVVEAAVDIVWSHVCPCEGDNTHINVRTKIYVSLMENNGPFIAQSYLKQLGAGLCSLGLWEADEVCNALF